MARTGVEEAHDLSSKLFAVVERMVADFEAIVAEHGLTGLQARTLLSLEQPSRMSAIAGAMSCDASNVTGLADRLERLGLIERVPDPQDRRVKLLSLTDAGQQRRTWLAEQVGKESTVTARLGKAERRQLETLLDKLLAE